MRSLYGRILAGGMAAGVATVIATTVAASPASAAAPCGWTPANNSNLTAVFGDEGVNIRNGGGVNCTILGEGYTTHSVSVRCSWNNAGENATWLYLTDRTTGVTGWSRSDFLRFGGALPPHPAFC